MIKTSDFKAAWWLTNPHLQTLWPLIFREKNITMSRERIELPDGDFIDLDWVNQSLDTPIVIILHGLEGSSGSHYVQRMLITLSQLNYRCVVMHFRSCSGYINRLPRCYHSGETNDFDWVLSVIQQRYPRSSLAAIGYSLGGNVLLKWLGEAADSSILSSAVSVPLLLNKSADRMQQGFSRFYQWHFVTRLKNKFNQKQRNISLPITQETITQITSFWEFDDKVTAPLHGFVSANDYYQQSSARQYLKNIKTPTLIIQARDDPFTTPDIIPTVNELSPHVTLEISEKGGHLGFISGAFPGFSKYWLQQRIPEFLEKYCQTNQS